MKLLITQMYFLEHRLPALLQLHLYPRLNAWLQYNATPGFNIMHKVNCTMRRETFNFWDLVWLIFDGNMQCVKGNCRGTSWWVRGNLTKSTSFSSFAWANLPQIMFILTVVKDHVEGPQIPKFCYHTGLTSLASLWFFHMHAKLICNNNHKYITNIFVLHHHEFVVCTCFEKNWM